MNAQPLVTRRHFLKISAGAGLVLGVYLSGCQSNAPAAPQNAEKAFSPTVYLKISPDDTVTVIVPRVEMGQGVRTALSALVAEELEANWQTLRIKTAPGDPKYGNQETGGSTSIDTYWTPLRQAGALARTMLITAAAQIWNADPAACIAEAGQVINQNDNRRLSYGDLAEKAAQLPVPAADSIPLKDPADFKLIGKSLKRVDDPQFVDGSAIFASDIKLPNMRYAAIVRPPVFGATLQGFDAANAKTIAGVLDVVEIDNAVAVVAKNTWAAIQGQKALQVAWDEGQYASLNSETIRQEILARLPKRVTIGNQPAQLQEDGGLDILYEIPNFAHAPMEAMNSIAHFKDNACQVWTPTQAPQLARAAVYSSVNQGRLAKLSNRFNGWSQEAVTINVPLMGGGFGRRLNVDYAVEAAQVSKAVNAPVQVIWTREDDIQHDFYFPMGCYRLRAALKPQAKIEKKQYQGPDVIPHGAWRSVQNFSRAYAEESFIDELAHALGEDPYTLRMKRYQDPRLKNVLQLAAEKGNWGDPLPAGWGRGIAAYSTWKKTPTAEVVELSVSDAGEIKVHRVVCVVDCGIVINPDMVAAQMEGGIVFALTAALKSKITIKNGRVQQSNFHDYPILRMDEMPKIEVHIVPSSEPPTGTGEMSGPPLTPAVANAVFNATGVRVRHIPILPEDLF